mgnify:FL=1
MVHHRTNDFVFLLHNMVKIKCVRSINSFIFHCSFFFFSKKQHSPVHFSVLCLAYQFLSIDLRNKRLFLHRQAEVNIIVLLIHIKKVNILVLVYIIPPVINMFGQMFSIGELIASGYASLVSSGAIPIGPINMLPFFQPIPCKIFPIYRF